MIEQYFKGDPLELKFYQAAEDSLKILNVQKGEFYDGAYSCYILGELLYDSGISPLSNAIPRAIFRESFATIFDAFVEAGSFESYLTVFRNIFGDDVEVTFTIPAAGKLAIDIVAAGVVLFNFQTREIVSDVYLYDEMVDDEGDNICFQAIKGFESQYEVEQMLFEMVPDGIFTDISLTIG